MSIYRELDPIPEHIRQFALKGKREHIAKVHVPNQTKHETRSIVNNEGRALAKKKIKMPKIKEIDTFNNADIYDTCKDIFLSKE